MSKGARNTRRARERIAGQRAREARSRRRRIWLAGLAAAVVVAAAAVGITLGLTGGSGGGSGGGGASGGASASGHGLAPLSTLGKLKPAPPSGPMGPEGVPIPHAAALAGTAGKATGKQVDGIGCQTIEQTLFHIHAHLTLFVGGAARQVPASVGIPGAVAQDTPRGQFIGSGSCFYWLHTHAADGIIHIESPVRRGYTLGEFFDEWGEPLGADQVGPVKGHVTALYNGRVYRGNPRGIQLSRHAQIQLDVGTPLIAPVKISWPAGL